LLPVADYRVSVGENGQIPEDDLLRIAKSQKMTTKICQIMAYAKDLMKPAA
jgi:hypothetical protein